MPHNVIDDDVRDLIARLEPWTFETDERDDDAIRTIEPFDASLYRMATMVAGLVSVSIAGVMAL